MVIESEESTYSHLDDTWRYFQVRIFKIHVILSLGWPRFLCTSLDLSIDSDRKAVWRCLKQSAAAEMGHMFTPMESGEACTVLQSRKLGITRLRYIPKKSGECLGTTTSSFGTPQS